MKTSPAVRYTSVLSSSVRTLIFYVYFDQSCIHAYLDLLENRAISRKIIITHKNKRVILIEITIHCCSNFLHVH